MNRIPLISVLLQRPRLFLSIAAGTLMGCFFPAPVDGVTRSLLGWDTGGLLYIILTAFMMYRSDESNLRRRAEVQDERDLVILGIAVLGVIASLVAIGFELSGAKQPGHTSWQPVALSAATVLLTWFSMQILFAVHYAHEYYNDQQDDGDGGLEFPAKYTTPDYWDFVYFSFIIGTAAQTADINITSRTLRRVVTLHCVVMFFFNTTILALAINVGAGLI